MSANDKLDHTLNMLRTAVERVEKLLAFNKQPEVDPRRHFYKVFNQEADEHDRDFHNKYHDDLNTALVFAGLFSAVASAFIIDIQQDIRPDYNQMSFTVLSMLLNATLDPTSVPRPPNIPVASGPGPSTVQVQSILFASLASALLAALLAMLGKQWLNLHVEGTLVDRSRHRELRMRGMITWRFKLIMECLPLVMQFSLLLLLGALARYMWDLSRTVSAVITAFTTFGTLLYLSTVFVATAWKTCPFQTPVSLFLRYILSLARQRKRRRVSGHIPVSTSVESFATAPESIYGQPGPGPQYPLLALTPAAMVPDLEDESTHTSDTNCISTMLRFADGSDAIVAVTGFIPEVDWISNVRRIPLLEVFRCLYRSFEFQKDGRVIVRPGMNGQAYGSAKALLHILIQRLCAGARYDAHIAPQTIGPLFRYRSKEDPELESMLRVLDVVYNGDKEIPWKDFILSDAYCCWLSYILRCRAWVILRIRNPLTKDILGFVRYIFSKDPPAPRRAIADCLLIVYMMVGRLPERDDAIPIEDKSAEAGVIIRNIYQSLKLTLTSNSSPARWDLAVEALGLMTGLKDKAACVESFQLFRTMVAVVYSDHRFWRPTELSLVGAFGWNGCRPFVGDPTDLLYFLRRCFSDQEQGLVRDKPIEQIMFALGGAPPDEISGGLSMADFTEPLLFNGLCRALRNCAPYRLRRATVAFLRHLDTQLFDTNTRFTEDQATELVSGWSASARESLDRSKHPLLVQATVTTLLGLLDSPFWRKFIPDEHWDILQHLHGIDDELLPRPLYRCLKNVTIIPHLLELLERGVSAFTLWVALMWAKHPNLSEEVKTQLGNTTEGVAHSTSKSTVAFYASVMDEEIERLRRKISSHHSWSLSEDIVKLRERRDMLQLARQDLARIQRIIH